MNLAANLTATALRHPTRAALVSGAGPLTHAELDAASARVAGALRARGLKAGDRVGVMLPNVPQFAMAYYGVLRMGGVVVPMNPLLKEREVEHYVADSGAALVLDDAAALPGEAEPDHAVVERGEMDTAVILYTSGTTGRPKGAELTHRNLVRNVEVMVGLLSAGHRDVILGALPLFHSFGQTCGLNTAVAVGASLALLPRFLPADVLELVERHRVTIFEGVPTMYAALLNQPDLEGYDVSCLRVSVSGGAALPLEILHGFEAAFGCVILEGYGLSETSPVASFNHPDGVRKPGSIGTPVDGVEMRLLDPSPEGVGEIAVRGHNVMKGYWRNPEATEAAIDREGWFRSGDLGRVDDDGAYFIVDRKKELIIRGGYNVYPREIEEVLYEHPAVREAAVVGIPHPELGEEIGAAVALRAEAEVDEASLRDFVKTELAAYKYPRHIWFVDELPKGPTGKILKRAIEAPAGTAAT
ncbi:MAG TPA: long-chain fatty acid--CoA ligase [Solirubrobacteraceae bacterium]|nr:long-chain fatty acid--CoA ligase [Solirubrobacteraceae bacterium]